MAFIIRGFRRMQKILKENFPLKIPRIHLGEKKSPRTKLFAMNVKDVVTLLE